MSDNPYQSPQAAVEEKTELPDKLVQGNLTAQKLNRTAWVAIFSLLFSIPVIAITLYAEFSQNNQLKTLGQIISAISIVIMSYLLLCFRNFVESRFENVKFTRITYISIFISVATIIYSVLFPQPDIEDFFSVIINSVVLLVPSGIVTLVYGIKIIRIKPVYPYMKPLGWLYIASGIFLSTFILALFSIPLSLASEVLFILLFFHASRELRAHEAGALN